MKMVFIEESELYKYKKELVESRVAFKRNDDTIYLAAYVDDVMIGFVGYKILPDSIRLKTDYVLPEHREKGYYDKMFKERLDIIRKKFGNVRMTAYCTPMSVGTYARHGFSKKTQRNGITFVVYE